MMRNRMLIILGSIVVLFVALYVVVDYKNKQAIDKAGNPYGKSNLKQATIDILDDPMYENQIVPDALDEKLANKEDVVVYYFSPTCVYCQQVTPILVPLAEELGVDIQQLNLYEFAEEKIKHGIKSTPTLVYYKDGEEAERFTGGGTEASYRSFLEDVVLADE